MKQLLLIISMLLLTIDVSAGDVSREQAREIASQFLKEKTIATLSVTKIAGDGDDGFDKD